MAAACATASETPRIALAPSSFLLAELSSAIFARSIPTWSSASMPQMPLAQTVRLVTDDDRSVVDPQPIKIRLVVQPETRKLLGCQVVGAKAAEIVNLAATAFRTGLSVTQLADLAMVHPSASEALVRCLQSRFDQPGL